MKHTLTYILLILFLLACKDDEMVIMNQNTIFDELINTYEPLPEGYISQSLDSRVYALYVSPTEKYVHGVLGDRIEAEGLVVAVDDIIYELELDNDQVFEDIRPRLFDVDGDGALEFITIRTNVLTGAGIAIYKIIDDQLVEYASVAEIGTAFSWLNIVAIDDLDADGIVELAWIETPHTGGILKVAKVKAGEFNIIDEEMQYSNHAIGQRNMCLSVLTEQSGKRVFYVPNQDGDQIAGFTFENSNLSLFDEIILSVDFSQPLVDQVSFPNLIRDQVNCIF